jgi:hypothetical protein
MKNKRKKRKEHIEAINSLYGLDDASVLGAVRVLGFDALTDEALEHIAQAQDAEETHRVYQASRDYRY